MPDDPQLVVGQMNGDFQVKEYQLLKYFHKASALARSFDNIEIQHIPREQNTRVDLLSKLSTGKEKGQLTIIIRQVLLQPSVEYHAIMANDGYDWRKKIQGLMRRHEGQALRPAKTKKITQFLLIEDDLYRRGFSTPPAQMSGRG